MEIDLPVESGSIFRPTETSAAAGSVVAGQTFILGYRQRGRMAGLPNEREGINRITVFFSVNDRGLMRCSTRGWITHC